MPEVAEVPTPLPQAITHSGAAVAPRAAYALSALSGLLYFLAFPGTDLWPLAFVALVPLAVALKGQPAKVATLSGWIAGFVMTMAGFYWLQEMLVTFSGFPAAVCFLFVAILCAYQAGRIALMGWLCARVAGRGWPYGAAFALAFAASEQVYPLLFPWAYGATVHQVPAMTQLAEIGGPIAIGLVLVAANLAFAELALARRTRRTVAWRKVAALAAAPLLAALYGAARIPMVDAAAAAAPPLRVGLVQADMSLMGKRQHPGEGLRRHLALTRRLMRNDPPDLVVWSETSAMRAVQEGLAEAVFPATFTRKLGVPAIFGGVLVRRVEDARRYVLFNSALMTDRKGNVVGRYDKQFLLGFGEYLPFGETFPILYEWSPNSGHFTPGQSFEPLPLGKYGVATFICYEDIIPSFVNRIMNQAPAHLLVNLTNDAWFGDTTEPWIHLALSKLRAVEQRRYFVRSTNSGVSAIVDPVGRVLAHTRPFEQATLKRDVHLLDGVTPYRVLGDAPWWLLSLVALAGCWVGPLALRRHRPPPRGRPSGTSTAAASGKDGRRTAVRL